MPVRAFKVPEAREQLEKAEALAEEVPASVLYWACLLAPFEPRMWFHLQANVLTRGIIMRVSARRMVRPSPHSCGIVKSID